MFSPFFLMANSFEEQISIRSLLSIFEGGEGDGTYSKLMRTSYMSLAMPAILEEYGYEKEVDVFFTAS